MPAPNGYEEENYRNNNKTCNVRFGAMLLECKDFFFNSYSSIFTTQNLDFFGRQILHNILRFLVPLLPT